MKSFTPPATGGRLGTYLTLGIGVGAIGAQTAEADIIHFNITPVTVTPGQVIWLNPKTGATETTTGGVPSFGTPMAGLFFNNTNYIYTQDSFMRFSVLNNGSSTLSLLAQNAPIGPNLNWKIPFTYMDRPGWSLTDSPWATVNNSTTGFIGLQFDPLVPAGYSFAYGWAQFTYNAAAQSLTLLGFAYDDTIGATILAGDIGVIPEPANAGLLLTLGATGVVAMRRQRKQQTAKAASAA